MTDFLTELASLSLGGAAAILALGLLPWGCWPGGPGADTLPGGDAGSGWCSVFGCCFRCH